MKVLITAGSTMMMIDKVRGLSNIFGGRTGWEIASYLAKLDGYEVTLLTSGYTKECDHLRVVKYKTYDDLYEAMERTCTQGDWDAIIHSAAVSDYRVVSTLVYADPLGDSQFGLKKIDSSQKISSDHEHIFLKLCKTEKIIDLIKTKWEFQGKVVKFKLQVDMSDEELIDVATKSMTHSNADAIIANCLEWSSKRAIFICEDEIVPLQRESIGPALDIWLSGRHLEIYSKDSP